MKEGDGWITQRVDPSGGDGTIALDSNSTPHIYYYSSNNEQGSSLRHAFWNGTGWAIQTVDPSRAYVEAVVMENGEPHIFYDVSSNGKDDLKHAYWNGSNWITQTIDTGSSATIYAKATFDSHGNPHVVYYFARIEFNYILDLRYAFWTGTNWAIQTLASTQNSSVREATVF